MAYRVQIEQISKTGYPNGLLARYEVDTKLEAVSLAALQVDIGRSKPQRIATVFGPSGSLVLAYVGRARVAAGVGRR